MFTCVHMWKCLLHVASTFSNGSSVFSILSMQKFAFAILCLYFDYMEFELPDFREDSLLCFPQTF